MCKVSLITLCYNQLENATKPMLDSLYANTNPDLFELIIVNNASTDGTKEFLDAFAKEKNNVKVIHNDENFGYAKGNNLGLKVAKGDYIFLLNNDLLFTQNWLERFVQILDNNKEIGLISCKTNYCGEDFQLVENCEDLTPQNYAEKTHNMNDAEFKIVETARVVFFCVGITRKNFEKVGYLDENYGKAWFEDDDYTLRTLYNGFKIAIAQNIFVFHNHSQSTSGLTKSPEGKKLFEDNKKYFEQKHYLYTVLKKQAENNFEKDYNKIKNKHIKYKKYFNILLPVVIAEFVLILLLIMFIIIK